MFFIQQGLLFYLLIPQTTDRKNCKSVLCLEQHSWRDKKWKEKVFVDVSTSPMLLNIRGSTGSPTPCQLPGHVNTTAVGPLFNATKMLSIIA